MKQTIEYKENESVLPILRELIKVPNLGYKWIREEFRQTDTCCVLVSCGQAARHKLVKDIKAEVGSEYQPSFEENVLLPGKKVLVFSDVPGLEDLRVTVNLDKDPMATDNWYNGYARSSYEFDVILNLMDPSETVTIKLAQE